MWIVKIRSILCAWYTICYIFSMMMSAVAYSLRMYADAYCGFLPPPAEQRHFRKYYLTTKSKLLPENHAIHSWKSCRGGLYSFCWMGVFVRCAWEVVSTHLLLLTVRPMSYATQDARLYKMWVVVRSSRALLASIHPSVEKCAHTFSLFTLFAF